MWWREGRPCASREAELEEKARKITKGKVSMAFPPSSSFTLIPNQKFRRSNRRLTVAFEVTDSVEVPTLGHFRVLPLEIFHILLEYLSVKDISIMSMVSKAISGHLISYISSPAGSRRLLLQDFHCASLVEGRKDVSILEHYRALGEENSLLLKRCTLLLPTRERLKFIHKMVSEVSCFKLCGCPSPTQCLGLLCYGAFLKILTAGWDELECHRVYIFLCDLTNLPRKVQTLVSNKPGHVAWLKMTEGMSDETSLKGLADAIKLLYDAEAKEWTADDVISLVDELTVVPHEWLLENNARLLILSGNSICFTFMASKAVNGRTMDLARMVVFLALVCEKDLYCMDWAVKMMQRVCKVFGTQQERRNFLQNVENSFARVIIDLLQSVISVGRNEEDSSFLNLFHLVNAQANFHKVILYLTFNSPSV